MIAHTDTSKTLERELIAHTDGEVLFTTGDRARYATDASIYQETPIGVFVPKPIRTCRLRWMWLADSVSLSCRVAAARRSAGKPWGLGW